MELIKIFVIHSLGHALVYQMLLKQTAVDVNQVFGAYLKDWDVFHVIVAQMVLQIHLLSVIRSVFIYICSYVTLSILFVGIYKRCEF